MCFTNDDCDWYAEVYEVETVTTDKDRKCIECYHKLPAGSQMVRVFMQEHEECHRCFGDVDEEDRCGCPKDKDGDCAGCQCEKPELGYQDESFRCLDCDKFLQAIEAAEIEEGCSRAEARPLIGAMMQDISDLAEYSHKTDVTVNRSAARYIRKAIAMFPELKSSGYITRMAKQLLPSR